MKIIALQIKKIEHFKINSIAGKEYYYTKEIADNVETCKSTQELATEQNLDEEQCASICSEHDECQFFFLNTNRMCYLYNSCTDRRSAANSGTTFKKNEA